MKKFNLIKKVFFSGIIMLVFSNANAFPVFQHQVTPDQVNPWNNLMSKSLKSQEEMTRSRYLEAQLQTQLNNARLQNQLIELQQREFIAAHPKIARDLANQEEARNIIRRNHGLKRLFRGTSYITELKQCSSHGNKYCSELLREELMKNKNRPTR